MRRNERLVLIDDSKHWWRVQKVVKYLLEIHLGILVLKQSRYKILRIFCEHEEVLNVLNVRAREQSIRLKCSVIIKLLG